VYTKEAAHGNGIRADRRMREARDVNRVAILCFVCYGNVKEVLLFESTRCFPKPRNILNPQRTNIMKEAIPQAFKEFEQRLQEAIPGDLSPQ
jgi:hypothetical protein